MHGLTLSPLSPFAQTGLNLMPFRTDPVLALLSFRFNVVHKQARRFPLNCLEMSLGSLPSTHDRFSAGSEG